MNDAIAITITAQEWNSALAQDIWDKMQRRELFEEMRAYRPPPLMLPRVGLVTLLVNHGR